MPKDIAIVDENNEIIGSSPRIEAYFKGLWHRIVVVYVFNTQGQIYIQKRSSTADTSPNMWDHSAAGHVDVGEEPENAAKRELHEELGIVADTLTFISSYKTQRSVGEKHYNRFWYVYQCTYDGKITLQQAEVADGKFVNVDWLKKDIQINPTIYTDGLKGSLQAYLESINNGKAHN